ncbi:MAG: hypothetical protein ACYDAY_09820 [Candidatus Dormibacteria bacterium]
MSRFTLALTGLLALAAIPMGAGAVAQTPPVVGPSYGMTVNGHHALLSRRASLPNPPQPADPGMVANNLEYGGGAVQHNPHAYIVYWGWTKDPAAMAPRLESFLSGAGGSPWLDTQSQYCDGTMQADFYCAAGAGHVGNPSGLLRGVWHDNVNAVPNLAKQDDVGKDPDLQAEAVRAAAHFGDYSVDAQYVIATPMGNSGAGFAANGSATGGWCAYHYAAPDPAHGQGVVYTDLPYLPDAGGSCGANFVNSSAIGALDGVSIVEGHEFAEAMTDPIPFGGWISADGSETGDKCAWVSIGPGATGNITLPTGNFPVQSLWSNLEYNGVGECQMVTPLSGSITRPYAAGTGDLQTAGAFETGPLPGGPMGRCAGGGPAMGGTCFAIPHHAHSARIVVADKQATAVTVDFQFTDGRLPTEDVLQQGSFCTTATIPVFPDQVEMWLDLPVAGSVVNTTLAVPPPVPPPTPTLNPCGVGAFATTGNISVLFS